VDFESFDFIYDLLERRAFHILLTDFVQLTPAEQVLYVIWVLDGEVKNGGFDQYLWNPSGRTVPHLTRALTAVGAGDVLSIAQRALAIVPADIEWSDDVSRTRGIDSLSDAARTALGHLDFEYYEQGEGLLDLLKAYVLANSDDFDVGVPE
jgi:hypothetical protein